MKKFLEDLEAELKNNHLKESEIEEILQDHEEMIKEALNEGLSEDQIKEKFGNPEQLAKELSELSTQFVEPSTPADEEGYYVYKELSFEETSLDVFISLVSEDTKVHFHEGNQIRVLTNKSKLDTKYQADIAEGKFVFQVPKMFGINMFYKKDDSVKFLILLPKKLEVKNFTLIGVSLDVEVERLHASKIVLKTTSGDMKLNHLLAEELNLDTVSGDTSIKNSIVDKVKLSQVSGDLSFTKSVIKTDFFSNSVSGDILFEEVECKEGTFRTVNGDITGKEAYFEEVSVTSVNGDVVFVNRDGSRNPHIKKKTTVSGKVSFSTKE